ncbi:MAG: hypothetical protein HRT86_08850 [Ilumatobacteraceae bacterium]|nr:hypothetical protein [Ilumatobacteraceae bacterium]
MIEEEQPAEELAEDESVEPEPAEESIDQVDEPAADVAEDVAAEDEAPPVDGVSDTDPVDAPADDKTCPTAASPSWAAPPKIS